MTDVSKTIFEVAWAETQDDIELKEKELKKNELKREFERQFDVCVDELIKLERVQRDMLKNKLQGFNLTTYRENDFAIMEYTETQEELKKLYFKFFGEELNR